MKTTLTIFLLFALSVAVQPDKKPDRGGGNCQNPPCNPAPISFEWVLISAGVVLALYKISSKPQNN